MRSFFEWFGSRGLGKDRPWLIFGKGPSFAKRHQFDLTPYHTLSLNHVVRNQPVMVAHMIDLDVVDACGSAIEQNAEVLVLPWFPHVKNRPGSRNLGELASQHPILKRLNEQARLLWYNLSTASRRHGDSPVVQVRCFSAEAALNLLTVAGVTHIRSLGVDGGVDYSSDFSDLKGTTLLANKRTNFNRQFEEIAKILLRTGIDYAPLDIDSPIRVYVAATESEMLPVRVLEYSIRKHTSMSVDVFPLCSSGIEIPLPRDPANRPRTPFSFQRFLIPELTNHRGRAIYLDADMQVFKDIRQLWTLPFNGADLLTVRAGTDSERRPQFSVMLLNCESLKWNIKEIVDSLDRGDLTYDQLMYEMKIANNIRRAIDPSWNSLERYIEGETALLHYTDMNTQPWVSRENPLGYLWVRGLIEAIDGGFIPKDYVAQHIQRGHVRPSLMYQIEKCVEDSFLLPRQVKLFDKGFIAPYRSIHPHKASPWVSTVQVLKATVRHYYQKSYFYWLQRKWKNYMSR